MRLLVFLLSLLFAQSAFSQNASEDLARINKKYLDESSAEVHLRINLFDSWQNQKPIEQKEGVIKKSNKLQYINLGQVESIIGNSYTLTVDHQSKVMVLQSNSSAGSSNAFSKQTFAPMLDSLLPKMCEKVEFKKESKSTNSYIFYLKNGEYAKVVIMYDAQTYVLKKLILYYKKEANKEGQTRIEVEYPATSFPASFSKSEFTYDKFLIKNGKVYELKKPYTAYKLFNNLID
jgi:hypothetical protein